MMGQKPDDKGARSEGDTKAGGGVERPCSAACQLSDTE